jgi:hypothetical protein
MKIEDLLQKPIDQLSNEELEQVINHRKKAEKAKVEKERKDYETSRDVDAFKLSDLANLINQELIKLKTECHEILQKHQEKLNEYGSIRSNSKGGFSMVSTDKKIKIRRRRDTMPSWDERSTKALELIHAFLNDFVKKRDQKMFEILMGFLVKNKKGDLEYSSVMNLLQHEDKFDDNRWKEGLRLIKESYSSYLKGYQYDFEFLNEISGKYEKIELNFSAL